MKPLLTIPAAILVLTTAVGAETAMDADGDGAVTLQEAQAVFPEVTAEMFAALDTDADGILSETEVIAATEAGLLPS